MEIWSSSISRPPYPMPAVVKVRIVVFRLHGWIVRRIIDHSIKKSLGWTWTAAARP